MWSTSSLVLLACFCFSLCFSEEFSGARLAISLPQVAKFLHKYNGILNFVPIQIPDYSYYSENSTTLLFSIHNTTARGVSLRDLEIAATGQTGFSVTLTGLSVQIDTQVSFGQETKFVTATLNQTDLNLQLDVGWNQTTKKSIVKMTDFNIKVANNSIDFFDPTLNSFVPLIISLVRQISPERKKTIITDWNENVGILLEQSQPEINIDDYVINLQQTNPLQNKDNYTFVWFDGRSHVSGRPSSCQKTFRKFETAASASVQIYGTPDMLECLFYTHVDKLNTLDGASRPFGPGSSVRLLPNFNFDLRDSGKLNLFGQFELDIEKDGKTVNHTIAMDGSFDITFPRHDATGLDTSVIPRYFKLKPLRPSADVDDLIKKLQVRYPAGQAQNWTVDTGIPSIFKYILKYNIESNNGGLLVPIQF